MKTVLAFDTSGPWCAAAVLQDGVILASQHTDMARGQGESLMAALNETLAEAGVEWPDLTAIGVGTGPGNFTGIRISISAARGLALGLGIPAIGVSRFEALALDGPDLPVIVPALRGAVWVVQGDAPPEQRDTAPEPAIGTETTPAAHPLAVAIAKIAAACAGQPQPRPAPLYLRPADAAPSSQQPPALIE